MDSTLSLAPWELPPQTGAEAAGLADLRAMLAELSDASLERILFGGEGDDKSSGNNSEVGGTPCSSPSSSVVAEARRAGELDELLQKHLSNIKNVERLAWSNADGAKASPSPSTVNVVASAAAGGEAVRTSHSDSLSPRSSIARWWANRKTAIGRKGRRGAKDAAAAAAAAAAAEAAAAKEAQTTTTTTSSPAAAIIFAREAAVALSSSDAGVAGAAAWAVTRWLALHPGHWRALLDAGCVVPLVELLMNNSSGSGSGGSLSAVAAAAANAFATPAAGGGGGGAPVPASAAAVAATSTANSNSLHDDDAPAAACAALALRAIASSGPDAQAAAAAAGAVGAAVDALEAVEDDGLWTGLAAVEEEEVEQKERERQETTSTSLTTTTTTTKSDNDDIDGSCSSPRSPSSFPSPPQLSYSSTSSYSSKKKNNNGKNKNPLLAHRRAQQEALASLIGALTAGNEAVALAATAAGCLPRLLALLSPSRNYSPALAACALFSLQPLAEVPGVRARFLLQGLAPAAAGAAGGSSGSSNVDSRNPVALVTASLPRLLGVSGATRAAAMLLLSLLEERGGGEDKQGRERESERRVFLRWMAEADTPGELVRVLRPWTEEEEEEGEGGAGCKSGSSSSSAPSTPLSPPSTKKQQKETHQDAPRLSAATVAAVGSALAAIARSGDRSCASLISSAGGADVLRGVVRRAETVPSAARSARAALEALGEREEGEEEDEDDGDL